MYYHTYAAVCFVTPNGMYPGVAIVTRPSQQRQVFDHSPNPLILCNSTHFDVNKKDYHFQLVLWNTQTLTQTLTLTLRLVGCEVYSKVMPVLVMFVYNFMPSYLLASLKLLPCTVPEFVNVCHSNPPPHFPNTHTLVSLSWRTCLYILNNLAVNSSTVMVLKRKEDRSLSGTG